MRKNRGDDISNQIPVICENCGKLVMHTRTQYNKAKHHYCSNKCQKEVLHRETYEIRKCEICGTPFEVSKKSTKRFCSNDCQHQWQRKQVGELNPRYTGVKVTCENCGKEYSVRLYKTKNGQHLFCSTACRQSWFSNVYSQSQDCRNRSRECAINLLSSGKFNTLSKPQVIINNILDELNIKYENEKDCNYYAIDNYLPDSNLMIEVMGDFWHCNPIKNSVAKSKIQQRNIPRDKSKHSYIKKYYGIEILYLWEKDINEHPYLCKRLIKEYIKNKGVLPNYHSFNYYIKNNQLNLRNKLIIPYQDR